MRKFEVVQKEFRKFPDREIKLPERATRNSCAYDFFSNEDVVVEPGDSYTFTTDVCAQMYFDNVLEINTRSGNGIKRGIKVRNVIGYIDSDYYGNSSNGGNIMICIENTGNEPWTVKIGDRIAQGKFSRYLITDDDKFLLGGKNIEGTRNGGLGSTGGNGQV